MTQRTTTTQTIVLTGQSGGKYTYWLYPIGQTFKAVPGNYFFSKRNADGNHAILYVGETGDLSDRFDNHHKMPCVRRNAGTHIGAHQSSTDVSARRAEEKDLVDNYGPPCNG